MARSSIPENSGPVSFRDKAMSEGEKRFHQFSKTAGELEKEVEQYWHSTEGYIKKNPVKSTVIAGVIGLFLGKLLSK